MERLTGWKYDSIVGWIDQGLLSASTVKLRGQEARVVNWPDVARFTAQFIVLSDLARDMKSKASWLTLRLEGAGVPLQGWHATSDGTRRGVVVSAADLCRSAIAGDGLSESPRSTVADKKDVDLELVRLKRAAAVFHAMLLPDRSTRLGRFAHNLHVLDSTTVTPVVLFLAERLGSSSEEFLGCLKVLESYLVRRTVCGRPTKAYNRIFPGLLKRLSEVEVPSAALVTDPLTGLSGGETQDWPDDAAFQKAWLELNTYKALRTAKMRIPLIADTHSRLIADSVPGDRGHPERGA